MTSPYAPPRALVADPERPQPAGYRFGRVAVFALLAYAVANLVGVVYGLTFLWTWPLFGSTLEAALPNNMNAMRGTVMLASVAVYYAFLAGVRARLWQHAGTLFVAQTAVISILEIGIFGSPAHEVWRPGSTARLVLSVLAAYALTRGLRARRAARRPALA